MISSSIPDWELRQRLSCLEGSEALPEDVPPGTVDRLFAALGSEDPHLGDEIGAATLAQWIVIKHALPPTRGDASMPGPVGRPARGTGSESRALHLCSGEASRSFCLPSSRRSTTRRGS